jgi:hypothetical protein
VRSHAKASTAGSTQRQAGRLGRIFRGVLATLGASPDAKGSGGSKARRLALSLCALAGALVTLALAAAPASALKVYPFLEEFGSLAKPTFGDQRDLAVDQGTGNLLVVDAESDSIRRFNPDGTAADFSALGTNVIDGQGPGADETPQNGLGFNGQFTASQIAIDDSGTATDGNIYATGPGDRITVFSEAGEYLGQLTGPGLSSFGRVCGVAVDPAGAVYVGDPPTGVQKFVPSANPPLNGDHTATFASAENPVNEACQLAAGAGPSAGFLFALSTNTVNKLLKVDTASGEVEYIVNPIESHFGYRHNKISVDPGSGNVYLASDAENLASGAKIEIEEYDASRSSFAKKVSTTEVAGEVHGLAIDQTSGKLYVSREGTDKVEVFGPPIQTLEAWSEDVVFNEATLKAEVNPEGLPTTYHFEWGTTTAYGSSSPESSVGSDRSNHEVTRFLQGLAPGTTYHYRVLATNSNGVNEGSDHTFTTYEPFPPQTNCANQAFRIGVSANLPDCRAYEMVSPLDKGGRGIIGPQKSVNSSRRGAFDRAATGGEAITYTSGTAFGDAVGNRNANQYLSRRSPNGWSTHAISPALKQSALGQFGTLSVWNFEPQFLWFSDDLSTALIKDHNQVPLSPDAPEGFGNIFRRDNLTDTYSEPLITSEPLLWEGGVVGGEQRLLGLEFKGRSEDGSRVIFESEAQLTPDAPATDDVNRIYEYSGGQLKLVSVLPGGGVPAGKPVAGKQVFVGGQATGVVGTQMLPTVNRAVSEDGSRVFWTEGTGTGLHSQIGHVYASIDGQPTVAVSESVTPDPSRFWTASTDGSKVIFGHELPGLTYDLYEFDVDTETPTLIAHDVITVAGASEDLSHLYFVSREALDAGATAGEYNLYLRRNGTIEFIATVAFDDVGGTRLVGRPALTVDPEASGVRVTPDGSHIVFLASRSLTGYDNTDAVRGEADTEVYRYDADAAELTCVSCNPSGARPHGAPTSSGEAGWVDLIGSPEKDETGTWWAAAWIPGWENQQLAARLLSPDGNRVFFNAHDALVPQDTNGQLDVYQWEALGTGSCAVGGPGYSQQNEGCVSLISTGKSDAYSEFIDATPDGSDVFIRTESAIDPRDTGLMDIYDARVGGGYPPPPPPPAPCVGDDCQNVPAPPNDPTPASASFRGAGDPAPAKARRRCRARKRHSAKGKRQAKKQAMRCKRAKRRVSR